MLRALCLLGVLACVSADAFNETQVPPPMPEMGGGSMGGGSMGGGSMGAGVPGDISSAVAAVAMQQGVMSHYATVLLEWQSAQTWSSAVSMRVKLSTSDDDNNEASLEEQPTQPTYGYNNYGSPQYNMYGVPQQAQAAPEADFDATELELQSEKMMWFATKLMWLESSQQLNKAQSMHYQNKVQLMMIQASGAASNPAIAQALGLMYYRSILETLRSSFMIQRQDSWTTWLVYEMLETTEFNNGDLSDSFALTMKHSEHSAMKTWLTSAMIDVQTMFIDYYLNMMVSKITGVPTYGSFGPGYGSFGMGPPVGSMGPGGSFLEEEVEAEPAEPSKPSIGSPAGSYMMYWIHVMKFQMRVAHMTAAQSSYYASTLGVEQLTEDIDEGADMSDDDQKKIATIDHLKKQGIQSWAQWAQIRLMLSYYEIVSMFYGMPVPHNTPNGAAAMNMMQTDAAATPAEPAAAAPAAAPVA